MYFIDELALRAGNEKGEDEADTVGCCSLRCEHVTIEPPNWIVFDFLGKDSIRYYNRKDVDAQVFKNIRIFKDGKEPEDNLFDRVTVRSLFNDSCIPITQLWIDYRIEQALDLIHEGSDCQGLPYVQRVVDIPTPA